MMTLPSIPRQFHKYIDIEYMLSVYDCIPTKEIEVGHDRYRVAKFYQNKSHTSYDLPSIIIPESIFFEIHVNDDITRVLISRENHLDIYLAGQLLEESRLTGPRIQKYLTLFRAYECLTKPKERDIYLSSIRHCLSHSSLQLTHPNVINALNELFGGLQIDLSQFKHKKEFYLSYWRLLKEVDSLLIKRIEILLPSAKEFLRDLKIIS